VTYNSLIDADTSALELKPGMSCQVSHALFGAWPKSSKN
jgi:hypothetical protein